MTHTTTVRVDELRAGLGAILAQVERTMGAEIDLDADYYWNLDAEVAFDMSDVPAVELVGQLSDDLDALRDLLSGEEVTVWHDLDHLLGILQRIVALSRP